MMDGQKNIKRRIIIEMMRFVY